MTPHVLAILAVVLLAVALLLFGSTMLAGGWRQTRHRESLDRRIRLREPALTGNGHITEPDEDDGLVDQIAEVGERWLDTPLARGLVADEDRKLLAQCGINNTRGQSLFFVARVALAILAPLALWLLLAGGSHRFVFLWLAAALAVGFMLPKWWLRRRSARRRDAAEREVPLLIDLLRLLQGVGLSVDQSLYTIENDFIGVLPLLGSEIAHANRQYTAGRTREQSLTRMARIYENDDLRAIARMLVQVDRHGGAVQEPLKQFSDRVREKRRMSMKEKIGKLTVKMTGVMVLTMLPALLIVTAGAGFLAVFYGLSKMPHSHATVQSRPIPRSGHGAYGGSVTLRGTPASGYGSGNVSMSGAPASDTGGGTGPTANPGSQVTLETLGESRPGVAGGTSAAAVIPELLTYTVASGQSTSATLTLANTGVAVLTWEIAEAVALPSSKAGAWTQPGATASTVKPKQAAGTPAADSSAAPTTPCASHTDVAWLAELPIAGSVASGASQNATVTVDAAGLAAGSYAVHLCVATNNPQRPLIDVPLTVTVTDGAAKVASGKAAAATDPSSMQHLAPKR
jgi:tight adherence protein C